MEMTEEVGVSKSVAVFACTAMAFFYVTILYAPTVLLRLPRPTSFKQFLIRRFFCAAISSVFSFLFSALILPVKRWEPSYLLGVYGMRLDHLWQAVVFPLSLTSLMYAGSLVVKYLLLVNLWKEYKNHGGGTLFDCIRRVPQKLLGWIFSLASNVVAWRNYVVAPITEELVFRACMIPLLLCGGFRIYTVIFLCPVFFSLAHLNHFFELYGQQNRSLLRASMVVGLQLGYTVIFGSYASFLFIRTGHLLAPVVAHIFCNMMGLPVLFSRRNGIIVVAFVAGMVGFLWLLFPVTSPNLYNARTDNCRCWPGHCLH
ncbi:CAAX prenyl protease 2 isoform X2 [Malania oleifera]|uniref:CAAX prenyl protease 2 isoform X2 n=1 Tax=Malania oleifera TaxID=397392 RepID=UPI0025ADE68B|nr:CAAX prenyl protease 2 isoform X2 [Malania oleifera]